jgi:hypothetical protein
MWWYYVHNDEILGLNGVRKGTSVIYECMYYLELLWEAWDGAEGLGSFDIPSYSGRALLETGLEHGLGDHEH